MTIPASVMAKMATLGLSADQADAVAGMLSAVENATGAQYEAAAEESRAKARARVQKWRERNVTERNTTSRNGLRGGDARVEDKTSNLDIEPQDKNKKREPALASSEFEVWYGPYPHKVQRGAAERAFVKARSLASLEALMAGVQRYIASKPVDRPWQNPATWLNGKGWLDQPANVVPMARGSPSLRMDDFLGAVIEQQERQDAGPDQKTEGYPSLVRAVSRVGWPS